MTDGRLLFGGPQCPSYTTCLDANHLRTTRCLARGAAAPVPGDREPLLRRGPPAAAGIAGPRSGRAGRLPRRTGQRELADEPARLLRNRGLLADGHPTVAGMLCSVESRSVTFPSRRSTRPDSGAPTRPSSRWTARTSPVGCSTWSTTPGASCRSTSRFGSRSGDSSPSPGRSFPRRRCARPWSTPSRTDDTVQGSVRIFVFDDRVEFHTPGRPPNTVDEAAMRAGVHVVRNPRIYTRLSDAGLVTRAGTGIRRIVRLAREATGKDITIEVRDFEVLLSIPRPGREG